MPHISLGDREFFYRVDGSGPVALFVHGYPFDGRMWLDQIGGLGTARTCIAPDLRGFGRSDPVDGSALTMETHADDLAGLVRAVGADRVDLVGLSMGGYVALAFAERHPSLIRSLALVDTKSGADSDEGKQNRDRAADRAVEHGRSALAAEMVAGLLAPDAARDARARVRTMIEDTPYETIVGALMGMRARPDRTALLSTIEVPAAVIVGEHDRVTPPSDAEVLAAGLSDSVLTVVPGAGHVSPVERPSEVNAALGALFARAG